MKKSLQKKADSIRSFFSREKQDLSNTLLAKGETRLPTFTALSFMLVVLIPDYFSTVLTFVGFVSVLRKKFAPQNQPRFGALGISILVYMAWMIVGFFYSSSLVSSFFTLGLWALVFTKYYFINKAATNKKIIDSAMYCGGIGAGIAGAIGIGQMVLYHADRFLENRFGIGHIMLGEGSLEIGLSTVFNPFWRFINIIMELIVYILPDFLKDLMPSTTFHDFETRACGTLTNPLFFATIEIMLIPFAAYLFLCSPKLKTRLIGLLCFLLAAGGIACSYSRGPYVYAVLVCILLLLHGGKKTLKLIGVGVPLLGGAMVFVADRFATLFNGKSDGTSVFEKISAVFSHIAYVFGGNDPSVAGASFFGKIINIFDYVMSLFNGNDISVSTRTDLWRSILDMIEKKPIFGYGTGVDHTRQMLHNVYNIKQPHAHNIFLESWVEHGVIGVILFTAILVVFAIYMIRLFAKGGKARAYAVTLFASVSGFVFCGMTDDLFYGIKPLQYLMMIFGLSQAVYLLYFNNKAKSDGGK
ncbi:MAG: O-antigen ligase family protein [Acutalibacteraceae bacterium]|nr:O-antigen ligase family protein [Acutalibacteraceae bacterium]